MTASAGGATRVFLIRHAETNENHAGVVQGRADNPLSALGSRQAVALSESLSMQRLTAVHASPLRRAQQTAVAVAEPHGLMVVTEPDLVEMDIGEMEGLSGPEFRLRFPDFLKAWMSTEAGSVPMPGGESLEDVQRRAGAVLDRIIVENVNGVVGVVSHNFVVLTLLCRILALPLYSFRRLRQHVAGVTIVDVVDSRMSIVCMNDICHLERAGLLGDDPWRRGS